MKRSTPDSPSLPDKVYFRIGEVSQLVGVDTHVLRYWESEFPQVRPFRGKSKQRLYRRKDVESLLRIRELLYEQGFTISGARRHLKYGETEPQPAEPQQALNHASLFAHIKQELQAILNRLDQTKDDQ